MWLFCEVYTVSKAAAEMTKKAVEENESVGKMDWDVMNKVLKNTINLDDEDGNVKIDNVVKPKQNMADLLARVRALKTQENNLAAPTTTASEQISSSLEKPTAPNHVKSSKWGVLNQNKTEPPEPNGHMVTPKYSRHSSESDSVPLARSSTSSKSLHRKCSSTASTVYIDSETNTISPSNANTPRPIAALPYLKLEGSPDVRSGGTDQDVYKGVTNPFFSNTTQTSLITSGTSHSLSRLTSTKSHLTEPTPVRLYSGSLERRATAITELRGLLKSPMRRSASCVGVNSQTTLVTTLNKARGAVV